MNLWMSCFIKRRSLVFRALLNPPVATLRLVKCDYFFFFFFSGGNPEVEKTLKYIHCTQCRATVDLGFIWLHRFFSQREFYMSFLFDCLEWSTTPKKNLLFFFFFSFPLKGKKKKFNLDSANTLVTSKAVKRKKEQIIRRWWELAHSPVEGKRGTE